MQARKKPVVVNVISIVELLQKLETSDIDNIPGWVKDAYHTETIKFVRDGLEIKTLEGTHFGGKADWLIQGVKGELYPCKPEIFAMTYDIIDEGVSENALPDQPNPSDGVGQTNTPLGE